MNSISLFNLPITYLYWHYALAWGDLLRLYRNLSWFLWNFFSISLLLRTLFSPWRRLREGAKKEAGGLLGSLIMNTILRFVGFFARVATIAFGLAALVLLALAFIALFSLWPVLPLAAVALILSGVFGVLSF